MIELIVINIHYGLIVRIKLREVGQIVRVWVTVFPHIRPASIIFLWDLQLQVLLEITKFHLHKSVPGAGIIRNAGIIRGRVLYEEIRYT